MKDELEERMAEIKKTAQKVRQKLKGICCRGYARDLSQGNFLKNSQLVDTNVLKTPTAILSNGIAYRTRRVRLFSYVS
jgi:hypothetical protein